MDNGTKLDITIESWVRLVAVLAIFAGFFVVRDIILSILAAVVIASAVEPLTLWLKKRGLPRLPSVITIYIGLGVLLAALLYFLVLPLIGEISGFIRTINIYSDASTSGGALSTMFEEQRIFTGLQESMVSISELGNYLNSLTDFLSQGVFSSISLVFGGLVSLILIVVLSFYLAVQEDGVGKFIRIITPARHEKYTVSMWRRSQFKIGRWMQGQLLLSTIIGVVTYIALTLVGIKHALLLAVLAGAFELIPLFGPILAAIPAMFVAFISGGTTDLFIVAGLYLAIQQFENHIIHPVVVKKVIGVPPTVTIIALVIGGTLAGFLGLLISVPMAAVVMELFSDYEEKKIARTPDDLVS